MVLTRGRILNVTPLRTGGRSTEYVAVSPSTSMDPSREGQMAGGEIPT